MSLLKSDHGSWMASMPEDFRHQLARRMRRRDEDTKLLVAGAVVVGVGLLAWHYLGPDMRRYLKIHSM